MNFAIDISNVEVLLEHYTRWLRHLEASRDELRAKLARLVAGKKTAADVGTPGGDPGVAPMMNSVAALEMDVAPIAEAGAVQIGEAAEAATAPRPGTSGSNSAEPEMMQISVGAEEETALAVTVKGQEDPWL